MEFSVKEAINYVTIVFFSRMPGSLLPIISAPPLTLYSFLYSSHISIQILTSFFSSDRLAILIAFSH